MEFNSITSDYFFRNLSAIFPQSERKNTFFPHFFRKIFMVLRVR